MNVSNAMKMIVKKELVDYKIKPINKTIFKLKDTLNIKHILVDIIFKVDILTKKSRYYQ